MNKDSILFRKGHKTLRRLRLLRDERLTFHDLSKQPKTERRAKSPVMQFYSSYGNIGNYTPVLGIQDMLGFEPDTWCIHSRPVDFDFINRNYKAVIIGGAGLFYKVFQPFWEDLRDNCRLPIILWGLGGCFPLGDTTPNVERSIITSVLNRSELANVRDTITADYYQMRDPSITLCPTVVWLTKFQNKVRRDAKQVLFASHDGVVPDSDTQRICEAMEQSGRTWRMTLNVQQPHLGLMDMITGLYCRSRIVVATRLHGAIIAYGLGIPFVAMVWDDKVTAFNKEFRAGSLASTPEQLTELLKGPAPAHVSIPEHDMSNVRQFGKQVVDRLRNLGIEVPQTAN